MTQMFERLENQYADKGRRSRRADRGKALRAAPGQQHDSDSVP